MKAPFKYFGGKSYLKRFILEQFVPHTVYIEAFGGAGNVILNKPFNHNIVDIYNELDPDIYYIMYWLQSSNTFLNMISETECNKETFEYAKRNLENKDIGSISRALCKLILLRMSRSGLGKDFSESKRLRGGRIENVNAWENFKKELNNIQERLSKMILLNKNAFQVIPQYDAPDALYYLDPTYPHCVRTTKKAYGFELTDNDHIELCKLIRSLKGKVIISSYQNPIYDELLNKWRTVDKIIANHASQSKIKQNKVERLYINY